MAAHTALVILVFILSCFKVDSARILCFFPVPFHSHQMVFREITEELAQRGHQLVMITPMPHDKPYPNITEIDVQNVSLSLWNDGYSKAMGNVNTFGLDPITFWETVVFPTMAAIVDAGLSTPEMQAIIQDQNQHFDLLLVEACIRPSLAIAARFKAPVIQISSFFGNVENFLSMGAQVHPLLFPEYNVQKIWNLSFWEKLHTVYTDWRLRLAEWLSEGYDNGIIRKHFGESSPSIQELKKKVHMLFLNVHHIWDNNRPVPPSIIYMGALHLKRPKALPKELQKYLDTTTQGVVYMSLGSKLSASDLPPKSTDVLFSVFKSLPYQVLLKWNGKVPANLPGNVRIESWLPQNDLLHHPNIKVFITQCGLQSTDEAIAARVPLIGLPAVADQWYNAQKYVQHGIGVEMDINNLEEDELRETILKVAEDKSYRVNLATLSKVMSEQREGGLHRAIHWAEYVAQHGALHLRPPMADVGVPQRLLLDVLVPTLFGVATCLALITYALWFAVGKVLGSAKVKTQ